MVTGTVQAQAYLEFVENKGQWDANIKFSGRLNNGAFALTKTGYRVVLQNEDDLNKISAYRHGHLHNDKTTTTSTEINNKKNEIEDFSIEKINVRSHAYEMKFLNANPHVQIIGEKAAEYHNNYFIGTDPTKWATGCKVFAVITYKNIYPGIDARYYTDNGFLKYDLIVNPGADVNAIAMYFEGTDGIKIKDGQLQIKTSVQTVRELKPFTYEVNEQKKEVLCEYQVKGNVVHFSLPQGYNNKIPLVIDPSLIFSTFSGSGGDNWGYTATYDGSGNFYAGGIVFGSGFPVSNGAFQAGSQGGNFDIGIIKYNPIGTQRLYATYIGGSSNEQPHSMVTDGAGNLIIAGRTASNNFPNTKAGPRNSSRTDWDIFITKLNATGTALLGSTVIGGSSADGVNIAPKENSTPRGSVSIRRNYGDDARSEVLVDAGGNIYLASCTQSNNFPVTTGAFQQNNRSTAGFLQDGVLIKTDPLLNISFSSYLGGTGDDAAFVIALNPSNNLIYVGGGTTSDNFPGDKSGTIGTTFNGGVSDGFVAVISNDGSQLLKSAYIGTDGTDLVYGIQFDRFSQPYIMGTATGSWASISAPFSQTNGRQYIAKLTPNFSNWAYRSFFGKGESEPDISPIAFLVDRCENVYVSGWGGDINGLANYSSGNTRGMTTTTGAIKPNSVDGSDFYFFVLERNAASLLYATFFGQDGLGPTGNGGEHVDGGTSRFDKNGVIYQGMCANCGRGINFPTTPGAWSTNNNASGGGGCNMAAVKIAFDLSGVGSGIKSSIAGTLRDTSGCVPLQVDFKDTLAMGKKYIWNFNDGSPSITTTSPNISHVYNTIGTYRVMLVSIDSSTCNIADTSYVTLRVRNDDAPLAFSSVKLPPCNALLYEFTNSSVAPSGKPFKANSFKWVFGDGATLVTGSQTVQHSYAAPGTYDVRLVLIDTNYCNAPDSITQQLRIASNVKAQFSTPSFGCVPYTANFNNTSVGGQSFVWDFGDGTGSTQTNPTKLYTRVGTYTIKLIATDPSTCNIVDSTTFTITVSPNPTASYTFSPLIAEPNKPFTFLNNSVGATRYKWIFGDGDTLNTIRRDTTVKHVYNATGTFNTCLVAYNNFGCTDTVCQPVEALIVPAVELPNAFSPNGDGVNDIITVQGFGIEKMTWKIYNRWGILVFVSNNQANGWDGRYKSVIQPQEVYKYVLDVEFFDKTRVTKKGDITLLR